MPVLNEKKTLPDIAIDRLPLSSKFPRMPESLLAKFKELVDWNDEVERWWKKQAAVIDDAAEVVAQSVNTGAGQDVNNLRVTLDGLSAEVADLAAATVTAFQAVARRVISVSAIASALSGITVSATEPAMPALNDYWVDTSNPTTPITRQYNGLIFEEVTEPPTAAAVAAESAARVTADGYLEGKYTLTVQAGDVVTGMNITSASGPGTTISEITFRADRFKIYNGSAGRVMFDVSSSQVRLGGVLVVDTPNQEVYIGAGSWDDSSTPFYVDYQGFFSLGDQLTWDPSTSTLTILGSISAVTGTVGGFDVGSDYIRDTGNTMGLASTVTGGTDIRIWAGAAFASRSTAPFRVTEGGAMVASSGLISNIQITTNALQSSNYVASTSGWYVGQNGTAEFNSVTIRGTSTIAGWDVGTSIISKNNAVLDSAGQLVLGTSNDIVYISATDSTYRLWIGNVTAGSAAFRVTKAGAVTATSGSIGGWTLGTSTLTGGNATIDSAGQIILGTSNDVLVATASDSTYRLWIGNATAGSATFRVTKGGLMTATNAVITGTITSSTITGGSISIGTGDTLFHVDGTTFTYGDTTGPHFSAQPYGSSGSVIAIIDGALNDFGIEIGYELVPTRGVVRIYPDDGLFAIGWENPSTSTGFDYDAFSIHGVQVLRERITGWTAASGTSNRAGFTASTPAEQALKALIDDLFTHGMIGT